MNAFPALAGMNRRWCVETVSRAGVPRTRGDEPLAKTHDDLQEMRSPHSRG